MINRLKNLIRVRRPDESHLEHVASPSASETAAYYDIETEHYLNTYGKIFQAARPSSDEMFLDYFVEQMGIEDGMKLLDAGCGVGGPSLYFAQKKDVEIDGVTISEKQVEAANEFIGESNLENRIRVSKGDFHNLGDLYTADSYDLVFFLESLGYADSLESVLSGVYKVLKPGGSIYIKDFFLVSATSKQHFDMQTAVAKEVREEYYYRLLDIEILFSLLRKLGFYVEFIRRRTYEDDYSKASEFENQRGHNSVCLRALVNPFPLYEPLELKFQKIG